MFKQGRGFTWGWFILVDYIRWILAKGNPFEDSGHRRPNQGEAGSWLTLSRMGFGIVVFGQLIPYKKMSLIDVMLACEGQKTRDRSSPQKLTQVNYHQNQKTNLCLSVTCILSSTLVFLISVLTGVFLRAVQDFLGVINGRSNCSSSQKFTEVNYHQNQKTKLSLSVKYL